jgi:hypothetical protein
VLCSISCVNGSCIDPPPVVCASLDAQAGPSPPRAPAAAHLMASPLVPQLVSPRQTMRPAALQAVCQGPGGAAGAAGGRGGHLRQGARLQRRAGPPGRRLRVPPAAPRLVVGAPPPACCHGLLVPCCVEVRCLRMTPALTGAGCSQLCKHSACLLGCLLCVCKHSTKPSDTLSVLRGLHWYSGQQMNTRRRGRHHQREPSVSFWQPHG